MYSFHVQFTGTNYCPSFQLQTSPHLRRLITIETAPKKKTGEQSERHLTCNLANKSNTKKKRTFAPQEYNKACPYIMERTPDRILIWRWDTPKHLILF